MSPTTILDLTATPQDQAPLPPLLRNVRRAADAGDDPFMPAGYLQQRACFELGATARGSTAVSQQYAAQADEVLVIELADGGVLITSASELQASLARSRPDLLGSQGEILFDRLRSDGAATRGLAGDLVGGLISRIFALAVGTSEDAIITDARQRLGELTKGRESDAVELGVSWLGTKALMWAIEKRLERQPGVYCWQPLRGAAPAAESDEQARTRAQQELLAAAAAGEPVLVFIHGTGSSTRGSFGDLQLDERELWSVLERQFNGRIYAFEHRTLSESPIENARQLLAALPDGLQLSLVSHSRGGLVGDLICMENFDHLIEHYRSDLPATGETDPAAAQVVQREIGDAHGEQRQQLRALASELAAKKLVVQRYVRVASPAQGTRLASGNLDVFLSGLLTLLGQIPFFFGNPLYSAFKRVVLEIARRRTSAHLVPGLEAMLPESPMARLLREAPVRPGIEMAVIAGDIEGGGLLQRLGVLLTDFLLFDNIDNDLVVDTDSMYAGIAPQARARALFDRGAAVSHFAYFSNIDTRAALRDWLVSSDVGSLAAFRPLPGPFADAAMPGARLRRAGETAVADLPVVVVLPGVMGSHLHVRRRDRVWFDPLDIASGGLEEIAWGQPEVEAEELFGMFYGDLCRFLAASHRVECFAYDWRQPLDVLGERLAALLDRLLQETQKPIRLLAHSMGGLVVRACIHRRRPVMDALMARPGARLVMLGTPNQGAYSMVENLLGKGDTLRSLVRLDVRHDMREVLQIVSGFRGALQLLPKPGFVDCFQGQPDGGLGGQSFERAETWQDYRQKVKDFWFGDGQSATPSQAELDEGSWLWRQDGAPTPALPKEYEQQSVYVFGVARNTPCGIREEKGRLKLVGTTQGDGTVTWASGRIDNVGSYYYMPAQHGDLPSTGEYHPALAELLHSGATGALLRSPPAVRGDGEARPVVYDAGPPLLASGEAVAVGLLGGAPRNRVAPRSKRRLEVVVRAMDLRFLEQPILLGHYEQDPISGAEALIDRELLDGDLGERYNLGLYAGPRGSATVVLRLPNAQERRRGSLRGAVVCGLGSYDGSLNVEDLTAAVRAGVLRYLLQAIDVLGDEDRDLPLATLLLGYNSSASVSVAASVEALVRGVVEANARFHEATRRHIRVSRVDIVELYQDTAITAAYALRRVPERLAGLLGRHGVALVCRPQLQQGEGWRRRLFDRGGSAYWPRLMITAADRQEPAEAAAMPSAAVGATPADAAGRPLRAARTAVTDRLRFLYVGQRARAESIVHQRQPGLVEMLVRQQIHSTVWQESFGRALFQLMVPNDFKDAARQLERIVLVVDEYTANLPWELMFADSPGGGGEKLPLALRTPVVRQFATSEFRRQVRQGFERRAFVVGNPSVEGFTRAFPDPRRPDPANPPPLPGAESEANEVAAVLQAMGYQVLSAIGADWRACDVLTRLYQENHRLLHISAHGIFDQLHADGRRRSGVVLSDGLLLTAAEIRAMETVPELVFLSCCHLGKIDTVAVADTAAAATVRDGNLLAASVARELIDCGVRCVVVAGWAVDDQGALVFGNAFYRHLLVERLPFGEAVHEARKAVWRSNAQDITWGAFQAYGDPGWRAEPSLEGSGNDDAGYASVEELLDELVSRRAGLARASRQQTRREIETSTRNLRRLLKEHCPAGWQRLPAVQFAVGALWADLGQFAEARSCYLDALQDNDDASQVPIGAIEQLANIEARLGEASADPGLIERALGRLADLDQIVAEAGRQPDGAAPATAGGERSALRGGAAKRLASLHATRLLAAWNGCEAQQRAVDGDAAAAMERALLDSAGFYAAGEGRPGESSFRAYNALNRLALQALLPDDGQRAAAIALAGHCRQGVSGGSASGAGVWDALIAADALLVDRLLDQQLLQAGEDGERAYEEVARAYAETLASLALRPRDLDSIVSQIGMLSRFCDARRVTSGETGWQLAADRLVALVEQVWPGAGQRADRPLQPVAGGDASPRSGRPRRARGGTP